MIVFILMVIKILATVFQFFYSALSSLSVISVPMLFVWLRDHSGADLLAFKSTAAFFLFCSYLLLWFITPWLTMSSRKSLAIAGCLLTIGLNLFDIVSCLLSALSNWEKVFSLTFSVVIIILSFIVSTNTNTCDRGTVLL